MTNMFLTAGSSGAGTMSIVYIVIMFAVLYFLMIRPQQKRAKKTTQMLSNLKYGDKVVTIGGIHGTVMDLNDDTVVIRVNDASKLTFDRSAVKTIKND